MATSEQPTLQCGEKAFSILDQLVESGEMGVTEIAEETEYHKSTVYVHLRSLQEMGIVVKAEQKYKASFKILEYSEKIKNKTGIYTQGRDQIDALAKKTGELVSLGALEHESVRVIHTAKGEKAIQDYDIGAKIPIESSTMGKSILAHLSTEEVNEIHSEREAACFSRSTDAFLDELEGIREQGFAVGAHHDSGTPYVAAPEEGKARAKSKRVDVTIRCISSPILRDGVPVGVVSLTGPAKRISGSYQETIENQVLDVSALIQDRMTYKE